MQNYYDDAALLRAVEIDCEALLELLFEIPKRFETGPVAGGALESADALVKLLNAISVVKEQLGEG